jgi:hypothetical protein
MYIAWGETKQTNRGGDMDCRIGFEAHSMLLRNNGCRSFYVKLDLFGLHLWAERWDKRRALPFRQWTADDGARMVWTLHREE